MEVKKLENFSEMLLTASEMTKDNKCEAVWNKQNQK